MFTVTNKSGTTFVATSIPNTRLFRIGNYTVGPHSGDSWNVFDWTRDTDVFFGTRLEALRHARRLVARSTRQDRAAVTA